MQLKMGFSGGILWTTLWLSAFRKRRNGYIGQNPEGRLNIFLRNVNIQLPDWNSFSKYRRPWREYEQKVAFKYQQSSAQSFVQFIFVLKAEPTHG
jgi:hypothetical protein